MDIITVCHHEHTNTWLNCFLADLSRYPINPYFDSANQVHWSQRTNYPLLYLKSSECHWKITVESGSTIRLLFAVFQTQEKKDFVYVLWIYPISILLLSTLQYIFEIYLNRCMTGQQLIILFWWRRVVTSRRLLWSTRPAIKCLWDSHQMLPFNRFLAVYSTV